MFFVLVIWIMCIHFICNEKLLCPVIQFTLDSTIFFIISHISMALYSTDMLFHFLTEVILTYISHAKRWTLSYMLSCRAWIKTPGHLFNHISNRYPEEDWADSGVWDAHGLHLHPSVTRWPVHSSCRSVSVPDTCAEWCWTFIWNHLNMFLNALRLIQT